MGNSGAARRAQPLNRKASGQPFREATSQSPHAKAARAQNVNRVIRINAIRAATAGDDVVPFRDLLEAALEFGHRNADRAGDMSRRVFFNNAQLLRVYAEAFRITQAPLYRHVASETAQYLAHDIMAPDGAFYTARDAQLNGVQGEGYLWTPGEIRSVLGEENAAHFLDVYVLTTLPRPAVPGIVRPPDLNPDPTAVLRIHVPSGPKPRSSRSHAFSPLLSPFPPLPPTLL